MIKEKLLMNHWRQSIYIKIKDPLQISLLILSKFKQIN